MRRLVTLTLIAAMMWVGFNATSQTKNDQSQNTIKRLNALHVQASIDQINPDSRIIGEPYIDGEWNSGDIVLKDGQLISDLDFRYDVRQNHFEVRWNNNVRLLPARSVSNFVWKHGSLSGHRFVNADSYVFESAKLDGFMKVMSVGTIELLERCEVYVKQPDYSVQFNVGSRNTEIVKKHTYYYAKGNHLYSVPKGARKVYAIFDDQAHIVRKYAKLEHLNAKRGNDLKLIFDFFNNLHLKN